MTVARKQDLKCSAEWQFCSFFHALEIKEGTKKITWRVGENKAGLDYRMVNNIMCSLKGGCAFEGYYYWYFKSALTRCTRTMDRPGAWLNTMTCPVRNLWSDHPVQLPSNEPLFSSTPQKHILGWLIMNPYRGKERGSIERVTVQSEVSQIKGRFKKPDWEDWIWSNKEAKAISDLYANEWQRDDVEAEVW